MEKQPVTILVTGFGPFDNEPINTSYLIGTTLPPLIPATPKCPVSIRITFYPYQIPASYEEIRSLVPRLHAAYEDRVDMILHMGMSLTRSDYCIERLAHRDNYDAFPDIYDMRLDKRDGLSFWGDCPPTLETSLDFENVFLKWRSYLLEEEKGGAADTLDGVVIRPSMDPGHFVCDFIYYSSLAEHWRRKKDRQLGESTANNKCKMDERPVIFMHVPRWNGVHDLERGKLVTIGLLRALASCWIAGKGKGKVTKS